MSNRDSFLQKIESGTIQDFIVDLRGHAGEITIEVKPEHIHEVLKLLKEGFGFNYMADITASDYYTDQGRFEVAYNITNLEDRQRLRVSCRVEEDNPEVQTVTDLWDAADWYEREAYDMIGIRFSGHPDLRRIYMPEDFEWYPLRKEFPLLGIPGSIQMPEKDPPKEYK